ncbi:MAG: PQQ-binding-like beta-propeller repeat protein [Acidobacteriota bacterium]|nr:PQQ-binding-like beta-propeller repeat protein [Acidobacteriota bacterium]
MLTYLLFTLAPGDWPAILGPGQDNVSLEKGIRTDWGEGLPVVWELRTGEGYAAPSIAGDRLYLFDRKGDLARLTCHEAATGKQIWQKTYPTRYADMYGFSNGPRVAPLIDGDRVYTFGAEGRLRCHQAENGKLVWDIDTKKTYGVVQNFFGVGASPVVHGKLLITQVGGSPEDSPGIQSGKVQGNGTGVVAFDKKTGKEVYRLSDELASYATPRLVKRGDRWWCFVFARGGLLAFDPDKGKQDFYLPWRAKRLESVNAATPVVVDDKVFISESYGPGGALLRFKPGGYDFIRKDDRRKINLAAHWSTPVHHKGYLYGAHGMGGGSDLRCVKLDTGELAWRKPGLRHANALYVDGHLIVTTESGDVRLIEATPEAYREKAVMKKLVDTPAYNGPVLAHGLLYVLGNHKLACLKLIER